MASDAPHRALESIRSRDTNNLEQAFDLIEPVAEPTNSLLHHDVRPSQAQASKDTADEVIRTLSDSPSAEEAKNVILARKLKHFPYIVWLTAGYTLFVVFAWAVICILVYRPITTRQYGFWLNTDDDDYELEYYPSPSLYTRNERWFQAARFIQASVAVVTIPLTSAVCSSTAVTFIQRKNKGSHFSLRQTMALADKGWFQYDVFTHLLRGRWKRYGSTLLYLALALHLLGGIISPLQSVFTTTTTMWTPKYPGWVQSLTDIRNRFFSENANSRLDAANLRYVITSTSATDPQSRLWSASGAVNCTNSKSDDIAACHLGQLSLVNMSQVEDPFFAELQAGFSTGLIRQYLPRINSSAARVEIDEADFPSNCNDPKSFYTDYSTAAKMSNESFYYGITSWTLIACMPGDQTVTPGTDTRNRQDFTEELYLNLSARIEGKEESGFYKITMNTTAGFFELPNYMNSQTPGPLLSDDPVKICSGDCIHQSDNLDYYPKIFDNNGTAIWRRSPAPAQYNATGNVTGASFTLDRVDNKGPLLTIALALFGTGSWVADRVQHPEAYINKDFRETVWLEACTERPPFAGLLYSIFQDEWSGFVNSTGEIFCVSENVWSYADLQIELATYVGMFITLPTLENAFEAAAFLYHELRTASSMKHTWTVTYDPGAGFQAPEISVGGIALISLLLGLYLISLIAMAIYSNWDAHWTGQLDSFAIMRLGAAVAEHLPLSVAFDPERIKFLDETAGWVGDATGGEGDVGELMLGAPTLLSSKRRYRRYQQESDPEEIKRKKKEKKERRKQRERERTEAIIYRYKINHPDYVA